MKNPHLPHYPTPAELYALELKARRMRAEEMGRLLKAGANAVRTLFRNKAKRLQHA